MNIIEKQHNYYFQVLGNKISSSTQIYVNTVNSRSYDLGSYNKTLIIVHEFLYKHDYMMYLIDKIVKSNTRVIVFDLTGHNSVSEIYKTMSVPNNSSFNIPNDYKINSKFLSKTENHYDFINFKDISFLKLILNDYNLTIDKNIFILSHSIGSLSVFSDLIKSQNNIIKGTISLSPNLKDLRFQNKTFYNLLSFFWPGKLLKYDLKVSEGIEKLFENDSKGYCTARSIKNIVGIQSLMLDNAKNITVPSLFFHAKDDQISSYDDSLNFFNELNTNEKQFISYDKGGHNLFIGNKSQEVIDKINSWMIEKL